MAGKFVTILNPGYSTLYTRDLAYSPNTAIGEATALNPFNPDSDAPLVEGEWLTHAAGGKLTRVGASTATATGAGKVASLDDFSSTPCFMYFQERGRYDAQLTRKAHVIMGPSNFEFRTKMIECTSTNPLGEKVFVSAAEDANGNIVSALVSATSAGALSSGTYWYAGFITRVHGENDAEILFQPGLHVVP
jgi:hypothetical protein